MKAVVLAGGRARRLFPITHRRPKCLLKVAGETLIDRLIKNLKVHDITDIVVVTGFRAELLERHLKEQHPDVNFTFARNPDFATTKPAYGLWLIREHLSDDFIYLNADVLCEPIIMEKIIKSEQSTTAIKQSVWTPEQVNVILNEDDSVKKIGKDVSEEESNGKFIGVTKLAKNFNTHLIKALEEFEKQGDREKFAVDAIDSAIQNGAMLYAKDMSSHKSWEVNTIDDFRATDDLWI